MPYCTASDVRMIIHTSLTDTDIVAVIEMSDAEIDKRLGPQSGSDKVIKKLSVLLSAHIIKQRQPRSVAAGEYSEDAGDVLEVWERETERIYRLYKGVSVKATEHRYIDESKRYPEEN